MWQIEDDFKSSPEGGGSMYKKKSSKEEILTVCANCQKVRTEDGEWLQDLYFLQKFPSVKISHSICPKCLKQLYPYLYEATLERTASGKQG